MEGEGIVYQSLVLEAWGISGVCLDRHLEALPKGLAVGLIVQRPDASFHLA